MPTATLRFGNSRPNHFPIAFSIPCGHQRRIPVPHLAVYRGPHPTGPAAKPHQVPSLYMTSWLGCIIPRPPRLASAAPKSGIGSRRFATPKNTASATSASAENEGFRGFPEEVSVTGVFPMHSIGRVSRGNSAIRLRSRSKSSLDFGGEGYPGATIDTFFRGRLKVVA